MVQALWGDGWFCGWAQNYDLESKKAQTKWTVKNLKWMGKLLEVMGEREKVRVQEDVSHCIQGGCPVGPEGAGKIWRKVMEWQKER